MSYRPVEYERDAAAIYHAVCTLGVNSASYGYSQNPSVDKTMAYIRQHYRTGNAYIVDEAYLLLTGVVEAWHSYDLALEERLVLKLHSGNLALVPKALEAIARSIGITTILASDSSLNFRMGNLYKRAGFRPITTTYYKEL